ncbi:MAG: sigma-54-dependent Fis family transcriptional regulator [Deltaproteobacteria bacterium]|nr:sigma-54-dependent Fis family transcriptional regulator [Deltaproteobacteria bacterium]
MSRLSLLVDLATLLAREVDLDAMLSMACERVAEALQADRATVWLIDAERGDLVTRVALLPEVPQLRQPAGKGVAGIVARTGEVLRLEDASRDPRFDPSADKVTGYTTRSMLAAPIREDARAPVRGVIQLLNRKEGVFDDEDERYLVALAMQLGRALSLTTLRAADEAGPGLVLRGPFNHVIGRSPALKAVYERIALAARSDATVLLRGETGTGKGLLARAIHVNSLRQSGPFVTVDCTTLPAQLVESELFGHERGAFTGADRRVPGRVEVAGGGTLLLDEIGDFPPEMQGKLLRFLQDRRFERVGGRQELTADVRILCATHRDLEGAVAKGTFREDLYYRVRVIEIEIPPLRERGTDEIEQLANYFAVEHARRHGRPPTVIEPSAMAILRSHDWPGNVRELEHWIESAVVLSTDARITPALLPSAKRPRAGGAASAGEVRLAIGLSLAEATRKYIDATLQACEGNKTRAAKSLRVGRNTLARALSEREDPSE